MEKPTFMFTFSFSLLKFAVQKTMFLIHISTGFCLGKHVCPMVHEESGKRRGDKEFGYLQCLFDCETQFLKRDIAVA